MPVRALFPARGAYAPLADDTSLDTDPPGLGATEEADSTASKPWLDAIRDAEKAFHEYQNKSDNIDKQYANLERLAGTTRDREIQLFWANISVMAPSVYSRPPVPVVIGRWKQRDELIRTTSEMLERAIIVTFEQGEGVDYVMRMIRDDLVILARGAPWIRLETKNGVERVCVEHADRKDYLHEPARNWTEVDWEAKRSWLTEEQAGKRFGKEKVRDLDYAVRKDAKSDADDGKQKAGIWELWCKSANKVVWVSEGCEVVLDQGPPHLKLDGFFPGPRPAFGTLQRRSLVPVPDMVFYKDQLEEINEITARIAALTEAVRVRGFYPSGAGEIGDAIEAALKSTSNNQIMVPVSNWSAFGGGAAKDTIVWLPIDVITATITAIIAIRKELISDVYEVTGLSDIMRGQTEASETLGAQQLKSQYGSIRIKDKQDELTRVARDITRIVAEVIAENFDGETLMDMTQMRLPSDAEIEAKASQAQAQLQKIQTELPQLQAHLQALQAEIQHASQDPEVQQMAQANPDQAKQIIDQVQQQMQQVQQQVQAAQTQGPQLQAQLQKLAQTVTIDKVMKLLREQKLRPFILDIETDSTIAPDENASKQRATEFVTAVGGYMKNALPLVETMPQASAVVAETLKFITDQFRAGRELQGVIDKFADDMEAKAQQPPAPNPEMVKHQADAQAAQAKQQSDAAAAQAKAQNDAQTLQMAHEQQQFDQQQAAQQQQIDAQAASDAHALATQKLHLDGAVHAAKTAETSEKHALEMRKAELASLTTIEVARISAKQDADSVAITSQLEALLGFAQMAHEKQQKAQDQIHEQDMAATQQQADAQAAAQDQAHKSDLATQGHEAKAAAAKTKEPA